MRAETAHSIATVLGRLHVRESGLAQGPAMVFWPSLLMTGDMWQAQSAHFGARHRALHPQRLRAAVLMNCTAAAVGWRQKLEFLALTALLARLRHMPAPLVRRAIIAFAGKTSERTRPEVIEQIRATVLSADPRSVHWAIRSVVPERRDRHAQMREVRRPVLVVAGAEDRTFPVAETRAMADAIPGGRFVVLPGVGHLAGLEAPAQVNRLIDEFLAG